MHCGQGCCLWIGLASPGAPTPDHPTACKQHSQRGHLPSRPPPSTLCAKQGDIREHRDGNVTKPVTVKVRR